MKSKADRKRKHVPGAIVIDADMIESPMAAFLSLFAADADERGPIIAGEIVCPSAGKTGR